MTAGGADAATRALLRLALRPDGAAFAAAAGSAAVDWPALFDLAQAHKVEALLAARAAAAGLPARLGEDLGERIAAAQRTAVARGEMAARTLAMLATAFGEAAVPYFVIKGSVLAHEVYGAPERRRFSDIDVVVRAADVPRAEAALERLGYRLGVWLIARGELSAAERAVAERLTRRFADRHLAAHDWAAPPRRGLLGVDLHWRIAPDRLPADENALWEHVRALSLDGTTVPTLSPPAALLHLAAHATRHYLANFRLLHLCDLAWAAQRYASEWPATVALAERWRMRSHLARVFALVEAVFDTAPPDVAGARERTTRATVDLDLLFGAPRYAQGTLRARLGPELRWAWAMRSLHVNIPTFFAITAARARMRRARAGIGQPAPR
ncbi:nucleotidyltransferase family protein [bacterium]|nr:nucleotidyltransferase family protein [bacterium]